jgi:acetoin utilization deacetylase AcuC-like enzyme
MSEEDEIAGLVRQCVTVMLGMGYNSKTIFAALVAIATEMAKAANVPEETTRKVFTTCVEFEYADEARKSQIERDANGGTVN